MARFFANCATPVYSIHGESTVEHGDFVQSTFPIGLVVTSAAKEQPVESLGETGFAGGLNLRLGCSVQVHANAASIAYQNDVIPRPAINCRRANNRLVSAFLKDQLTRLCVRAAQSQVISVRS
jgi:hypothetical protein